MRFVEHPAKKSEQLVQARDANVWWSSGPRHDGNWTPRRRRPHFGQIMLHFIHLDLIESGEFINLAFPPPNQVPGHFTDSQPLRWSFEIIVALRASTTATTKNVAARCARVV
jgi:hypothetical protein